MVLWIVIGVVALALLILGLALRALQKRSGPLMRQQTKLERTLFEAQEIAEVAQGLQAHIEPLRLRAELAAQRLAEIKSRRAR